MKCRYFIGCLLAETTFSFPMLFFSPNFVYLSSFLLTRRAARAARSNVHDRGAVPPVSGHSMKNRENAAFEYGTAKPRYFYAKCAKGNE